MQKSYMSFLLILILMLAGCVGRKIDYVWQEYQITPDRLSSRSSITEGKIIAITKGKSDSAEILVFKNGPDQYYSSCQSFADSIADQLAKEMRKKGVEINNQADKSLEITVNRSISGKEFWNYTASLEFTLKFGNGKSKSYSVKNSSPQINAKGYNGAVALAVIEIINDLEVVTYINE